MSKISQAALVRERWRDPALAAVALIALEIAVLTSKHRSGPLVLNVLGAAAITGPTGLAAPRAAGLRVSARWASPF